MYTVYSHVISVVLNTPFTLLSFHYSSAHHLFSCHFISSECIIYSPCHFIISVHTIYSRVISLFQCAYNLFSCHFIISVHTIYSMASRDTPHSTISVMTDNTNISVVDIRVIKNMPVEAPEPWTTTMYICLFVGCYDFFNGTRHPYVLGAVGSPEVSGSDHSHYAILGQMAKLHGQPIHKGRVAKFHIWGWHQLRWLISRRVTLWGGTGTKGRGGIHRGDWLGIGCRNKHFWDGFLHANNS